MNRLLNIALDFEQYIRNDFKYGKMVSRCEKQ